MKSCHIASKWRLDGQSALVTGGSKGIGKAVVSELASLGARVIFCSRDINALKNTESEMQSKGFNVTGIAADVSTTIERQRLIAAVGVILGLLIKIFLF